MLARLESFSSVRRLASVRLLPVLLVCGALVPWAMTGQEEPTSGQAAEREVKKKHVIGSTASIFEKQSKLSFPARVDTGATACSIHVVNMEVEDEAEQKHDNIGKMLRFQIDNRKDAAWIRAKIEDYATVTNSEHVEYRYKVLLSLRWKEVDKKVLVSLNDRGRMKYPLLLGRNYLRGDFLVDVDLDTEH